MDEKTKETEEILASVYKLGDADGALDYVKEAVEKARRVLG